MARLNRTLMTLPVALLMIGLATGCSDDNSDGPQGGSPFSQGGNQSGNQEGDGGSAPDGAPTLAEPTNRPTLDFSTPSETPTLDVPEPPDSTSTSAPEVPSTQAPDAGVDLESSREIRKTMVSFFVLAAGGQVEQACALQTENYLLEDENDGDNDGDCIAEGEAFHDTVTEKGLDVSAVQVDILSASQSKASVQISFDFSPSKTTYYLTNVNGAWLISGDQNSGDVG